MCNLLIHGIITLAIQIRTCTAYMFNYSNILKHANSVVRHPYFQNQRNLWWSFHDLFTFCVFTVSTFQNVQLVQTTKLDSIYITDFSATLKPPTSRVCLYTNVMFRQISLPRVEICNLHFFEQIIQNKELLQNFSSAYNWTSKWNHVI